jgi:glycosyltransferase involved in cell wall biosynthesis
MASPGTLPRIAFLDLLFNWPPMGGCWVDLKEIMTGLARRGFEVKLWTPVWTDYFPRGDIKEPLPFPVEKIHFNRFTFNAYHIRKRFGPSVKAWNPDIVFLGEGYQLKPHLLDLFSRDYPTFYRVYAYDLNCLNLHYWLYKENRICDGGFLTDPKRCHRCWHPSVASFPVRLFDLALGRPEVHPKLHFTHEYAAALAFTSWYRKNLPKWLARAESVIVYNEFTARFFRGVTDRIKVIPSGVDVSRFQPKDWSVANDRPVVFFPGRVNDDLKGFDLLLEACRKLRAEGIDLELQVTAPKGPGLKEDWVTYLGWLSQDQMPEAYRKADIVAVPSIWVEPFGITTLEAMAAGAPVVGSRTGGIAETLVDGETGLHFEAGNAGQLAEALKRLLLSPELRRSLGEGGRKRAESVYDWDHVIDKYYAEPFRELLSTKGGGEVRGSKTPQGGSAQQ